MAETNAKIDTVFDDEQQHVGEVYARALLQAAGNAAEQDAICDEFTVVVDEVLGRNPEFAAALVSPRLSTDDKQQLLTRVFKDRVHPTLLKFFQVLCSRGRLGFMESIARSATKIRDDASGRLQVTLTSAVALDEAQLVQIKTALKAKFDADVAIKNVVDPSILGGMLVRVGDTVYDSSVNGQLAVARRDALERTERALREKFDVLIQN